MVQLVAHHTDASAASGRHHTKSYAKRQSVNEVHLWVLTATKFGDHESCTCCKLNTVLLNQAIVRYKCPKAKAQPTNPNQYWQRIALNVNLMSRDLAVVPQLVVFACFLLALPWTKTLATSSNTTNSSSTTI